MQVTSEQPDPSTIVLDINVDEDQVSRAFDTVYREFSRHVNVPGFRPGKAPRAIVERYVNKDRVRERTREKVIQDSCLKAIEEQGITPYSRVEVEPPDIEDHKAFSYRVIVPLEPQVTLGEYTGLEYEKPVFAVTDEIVEQRIEQMRGEKARLDKITDRGVEAGDVLIAEVQTTDEGEEPGESRRQLVQVGNNIPGFDEAIAGLMPGEERSFELTYPDDYDDEAKRGKKVNYTVRLSSISARKLPDLDDAFAKLAANVDTVDALREKVRTDLEAEAERLSEQHAEQNLIQKIHDASEVYYPRSLVREEMNDDLRRMAEELRRHNVTFEQYLAQTNQTTEQMQERMAQQAEARVRTVLVLSTIAQQEGLQATDADIDAEFDNLLENDRISEEQYDEYKPVRHRRIQVANALVQQRLHDYLFANNTAREVVVSSPPAEESETEAESA